MSGITKPLLLDIPDQFTGERVLLRGWQDADTDALYTAIRESAAHIGEWLPWPKEHQTTDDTLAFIRQSRAQWVLREGFGMGIFARDSGQVLGSVGLKPYRWDVPSFEIGYWLHQSAEGHGYMSESVRLIVAYCFETLAAERLEIRCDARNNRSRAVPERLGFTCEGTHRNDQRGTDGTIRDIVFWAMIPDEYRAARTRIFLTPDP